MRKEGYIYLLCNALNEHYKIGMTTNTVKQRISELQTGNATEIFMVHQHKTKYPRRIETMLHNRFNSKRVLNEWFQLTAEDVINFPKTCQEMENIIKTLENNPFFTKNLK